MIARPGSLPALVLGAVLALGCGRRPGAAGAPVEAGGAVPAGLLGDDEPARERRDRGSALLVAPALPARAEVLVLAQGLAASALLDADPSRAASMNELAGELEERIYRVEGIEQDGREALLSYRKAARDVSVPAACEAFERAAFLAGEVARDPRVTYGELYRARRRSNVARVGRSSGDPSAPASTDCGARLDRDLRLVAGAKLSSRELEAIDREEPSVELPAAPAPSTAAPVQIVRVEAWPGPDATRIVFVLDGPATLGVLEGLPAGTDAGAGGSLSAAGEITLDFAAAGASEAPPDTALPGIVRRVRTEATPTGARAVIDLAASASRRVFHLLEPYRVVVDVARDTTRGEDLSPRQVTRVVLDAGHGGADPGAIGVGGNQEKDVTLDIVHRAVPLLVAQGLTVVLTRDDDRTVSLEERTGRANAAAADLFLSVHCNASESHERHGIETYVLDTTTDAVAGRVASRENATSAAANAELGALFSSLRIADQSARSARLAKLVQRSTVDALRFDYPGVLDGGVHRAGFYVLVGARMPGVLFETSYLSNPREENLLAADDYRQRLAESIAEAVAHYRSGD